MAERVLEAMLTQRVVTTRGEVFTKQLSVQDAEYTRNAIVKSLYEARESRGGSGGGWHLSTSIHESCTPKKLQVEAWNEFLGFGYATDWEFTQPMSLLIQLLAMVQG